MSLKMSAKSRGEVLEQARWRYAGRGKEGRSRLLDEVCALCGYERKYAIKVLGGRRAIVGIGGARRKQDERDCQIVQDQKTFTQIRNLEICVNCR